MFGYRFANVYFGWDAIQAADLVMATIWYSAAVVRDLPFDCFKGYLSKLTLELFLTLWERMCLSLYFM